MLDKPPPATYTQAMVFRPDATLNLASLLKHDLGLGGEVLGDGLLMPSAELLMADGLTIQEPLRWQLTIRSSGGDDDLLVTGSVAGVALLECRRCLSMVKTPLTAQFIYPMAYHPGQAELSLLERKEDGDLLAFGHPEVDFAALLTQLFAIDLPWAILCRPDCRGLSLAGVNLNEYPEAGSTPVEPDKDKGSPFGILKDLKV